MAAVTVTTLAGCANAGSVDVTPFGGEALDETLPSGFGSLRQEAVSVTLVSDDVQLRVTPLDPQLMRLTAPDTEARLAATLERAGGVRIGSTLALVSVYTDAPAAPFEPRDLRLELRGRRLAISEVIPISPEWGTGQLRQRTAISAVYRFDGDVRWLDEGPRLAYRTSASDGWQGLLPTLDVERARVRARGR